MKSNFLDAFDSPSSNYHKGIVRTSDIIFAEVNEAEAIGQDDEAIYVYILSGDMTKAVSLGLARLEPYLKKPFNLSPALKCILDALGNVK